MSVLDPGAGGDATVDGEWTAEGDEDVRRCGPWVLGTLLGQGGAGIVYAAAHEATGAEAAVKLLCTAGRLSPTQARRFEREIEVQRALDDPGIVRVLDWGTTVEGEPWVAMERLRGDSLAARMARGEPMGAVQIATLVRDIARTLARLHARGVVHRDVKPGNILLTAEGQPRLADFGLVVLEEATSTLTRVGARPGTPRYMAPEQLADRVEAWPLVDVHALGRVLEELLVCARSGPWSLSAGATGDAMPLDLEYIAHRATDPEAALRTPSCAALADDLDRWLGGGRVRNRPAVVVARARRWVWRHRALSVAAALAVVSVGLALVPRLVEQVQGERAAAEAADRWARLLPRLSGDGGSEFRRFVEDPANAGQAVLSDAWRWRAEQAGGPDRTRFAARAVRVAQDPVQRASALSIIGDAAFAAGDWQQLARLDPLLPPDPLRAKWLAAAHLELEDVPELRTFRTAVTLDQRWWGTGLPTAGLAAATTDQPSGVALVDGSFCHAGVGILLDGDRVRCGELAEVWPERLPDHPYEGAVERDGQVFYSMEDQRTVLRESRAGADPALWADLDRLHSYALKPDAADLDGDGLDELVVPLGQPYGYGFAVVELDADGAPTDAWVHRTGATASARPMRTAAGMRLVVTAHAFYRSEALFGHGVGGDGPARVLLFRVGEGQAILEDTVELPPFVMGANRSMVTDLDGDGDDEVLLCGTRWDDGPGSGTISDTFVLTTEGGRLREPWYLPEVSLGGYAQLDEDPEMEVFGGATLASGRRAVLFGMGAPIEPLERPPALDPNDRVLEALGQFEEAALAHEAAGEWGLAAAAWEEAGDRTAASLAAEQAGELPEAQRLAAADLDPVRAAALGMQDARLPMGPPTAELTPADLLAHPNWRRPGPVRPDVLGGGITIDAVRGAGTLMVWPLRVTGPDASLEVELDLTWMEWNSRLLFELLDEDGARRALLELQGVGSGGRLFRLVRGPELVNRLEVQELDGVERVRMQLTPFGIGLERHGERVAWSGKPGFEARAGERLTLRVHADPEAGQRLRAELRRVAAWGMVVDADREVAPLAPPDAFAAARLAGAGDAVGADWGAMWASTAASHPDHPELARAVQDLDRVAGIAAADEARLRTVRATAGLRSGRLDDAVADLERALALTRDDPRAWAARRRALALQARIALLEGRTDAARGLAQDAVAVCPDADLGRRLLAQDADLFALLTD